MRDIEFTRFFDFRFFPFYIVRCGYKPYRMPIASLKLENRICQIHKLTGNLNEIKIATHKSFGTKSIGNEYFTNCSSFRWAMRKKFAKCNGFSLCVCVLCARLVPFTRPELWVFCKTQLIWDRVLCNYSRWILLNAHTPNTYIDFPHLKNTLSSYGLFG